METDKDNSFCGRRGLLVPFLVGVVLRVCLSATDANSGLSNTDNISFAIFQQAHEASNDAKAVGIGDSILRQLEQKYGGDVGFRTYKSKLAAAEFLAKRMAAQLHDASGRGVKRLAHELFTDKSRGNQKWLRSVAPAKSFYETSRKLFSAPVTIAQLEPQDRDFLAQYYDLKLRTLTSALAQAGQALVIIEPTFKGTHDYVLVLPLLHASDQKPIRVEVLPRWMQRPEQLRILSDSCLLHFGLPLQSMSLAKRAAQMKKGQFSELEFYKSAAKKCSASRAHIAVASLNRAIDCASTDAPGTIVGLQFEIVQLWLDSENYHLAAGQARDMFEAYPDNEQVGEAGWLYHYALSRANKTDEILVHVDQALADKRCRRYEPKLMYLKWWAMRRTRNQAARIAALEYELLKRYGDEPMVAPILLSQATDMLARQDYSGARTSLSELLEKFPSTKAAQQAKKMLDKLRTSTQ